MTRPSVRPLSPALLRRHAVPKPDRRSDKDSRGRVLIVGGCRELCGAVILSGAAAMRVGAGKLQVATAAPVALAVAIAIPEALVLHLAATRSGGIAPGPATTILRSRVAHVDALLIGPGMREDKSTDMLVVGLVRALSEQTTVVLDAGALPILARRESLLHPLGGRVVITPHAGEMASLVGEEKRTIEDEPVRWASTVARQLGGVVVLKGSTTIVAAPDGQLFRYARGRVGLATSGSGDVLAGLVTGLAARGASPLDAALWGVYLHGEAGNVLVRQRGAIGFLAHELSEEVPTLLQRIG
ncbi:MAG: NAD(P)H-hydrate dehydratase [Gemmatimonadaceae bacterium]